MPTVTVNDIRMYYETRGEGEPLVLIPGLSTDVSEYQEFVAALSTSHQVIALDNRGAGRTDKPDMPYSIEMMADDTAGLLAVLGIDQAHILGTSMGGRIALALALRHPDHVKSLILISTVAKPRSKTVRSRLLLDLIPRVSRFRGTRKYPQPYYAFVRQRDASRRFNYTDRLYEIHVPTLILHGTRDSLAPYSQAEEMHAGIENSTMITFPGGHVFFFMRPRQVTDAISAFLATV